MKKKNASSKKKSIFILLLILASVFSFLYLTNATKADSNSDVLLISLVNQDPDPVRPGQYVDVRFKIENDGDNDINDVAIKLVPKYPFSSDDKNLERNIGTVFARQTDDAGVIVKYKVRVNEKAIEGTSKIMIAYKTKNIDWQFLSFDINIRTVDSTVAIKKASTYPEKLEPGKKGIVNITLKNMADSVIRDITFKLDLGLSSLSSKISSSSSTGLYYDLLPFAPIGSATEKKIKLLTPGQEKTVSYGIIAYPDADSEVYKVPIVITYYDELQEEHEKNDFISLIVSSHPDLSINIEKDEMYSKGKKNKITLKFVNKGLSQIKFLNIKAGQSDYYTILSSENMYIGNIDSDDYETAEFDVFIKDNAPKNLIMPFEIEYRDTNNILYKEDIKMQVSLYSDEEIQKFESGESNSRLAYIIIAAIIIIILAVWLIRRKRKA